MNIKDDLVRHFHWLRRYGLNDSHGGTASVRDGECIWVTPAECCADALSSGDLVECDILGAIAPSACPEAAVHLAIYQANPRARAVLQSHGPYTVAMTMDSEEFVPAAVAGNGSGGRVPVVTIPQDSFRDDAPETLARVLAEVPVAVVRGHGVFACAESPDQAYRWTTSLEHSARTAFIARQANKI